MYKKFLFALCVVTTIACFSSTAYAIDLSSVQMPISCSSEGEITPYADVIVYKYRIYNGVHQYRRWNETRGYWVDPYWINL